MLVYQQILSCQWFKLHYFLAYALKCTLPWKQKTIKNNKNSTLVENLSRKCINIFYHGFFCNENKVICVFAGALLRKLRGGTANPLISLGTNTYLLLTEFEGRTVSYGPRFFLLDLWPKREARGP